MDYTTLHPRIFNRKITIEEKQIMRYHNDFIEIYEDLFGIMDLKRLSTIS